MREDYEQLVRDLLDGHVIHTGETSWWLEGRSASLRVLCSPGHNCYEIVHSRSRDTFHQVVPPDWKGARGSDCLVVYDDATPPRSICCSLHLRAIKRAAQDGGLDGPDGFLGRCSSLLQSAMAVEIEQHKPAPSEFGHRRRALALAADVLLADLRIARPSGERVRRCLHKQRDHLLVFLDHAEVDATNNLAERHLRPAVIARKLVAGNKTRACPGARAILTSLGSNARQQVLSFIDLLGGRIPLAAG